MRRVLLLTSAVVFFDTLFFAALTPLLPHYVHTLHMGKTGAGVLSAAYPAGAFLGAIPSGILAGRAGVKRTVVVGLVLVAACTAAFGVADHPWQLDLARLLQGAASAFSWTGAFGWLVGQSPPGRRGRLIGQAFAASVAGALFGPVVGGIAAVGGIAVTFSSVAGVSLLLVAWAAATPCDVPRHAQRVGVLVAALRDRRIAGAVWFVVLPALLFGALSVLAPLRLSQLGLGAVAIGAVFLLSAALEAGTNLVLGHASDRGGTRGPLAVGLVASAVVAAALPWPGERLELAALVVCSGLAFGAFFTPGMTLLTTLAEARGLEHGYAFALVNLAWAPGQTIGASGGGALAHAAGDAAPYLLLSGACALTLAVLWRSRTSTAWTTQSAAASSSSSSGTTAGG